MGDESGTMERKSEIELPEREKNSREENFKDKLKRVWDIYLAACTHSWDPQKILDLSQ